MQSPAPSVSGDTRARIAKHILALQNPDQNIAAKAEHRLDRFGAKAVEPLLALIDHPEPMVRLRAAWLLGLSHDRRAFEPLCRMLRDPNAHVRYDVAFALGHHGDPMRV